MEDDFIEFQLHDADIQAIRSSVAGLPRLEIVLEGIFSSWEACFVIKLENVTDMEMVKFNFAGGFGVHELRMQSEAATERIEIFGTFEAQQIRIECSSASIEIYRIEADGQANPHGEPGKPLANLCGGGGKTVRGTAG